MQTEKPELNEAPQGEEGVAGDGNPPASALPLEEQLRAAEAKAAEHHDAWLRAKAEAENIRRRAQEDISKAHKFGVEKLATDLLPVRDSLEAALAAEKDTVESLRAGVELTLRQLETVFEKAEPEGNQPGRTRSSTRTSTRRSACSPPTRSRTPSSTCCRRATSCTTASCAPPW